MSFRVALADDDPLLRGALGHMLAAMGGKVVAVADGGDLMAALEAPQTEPFDVVVADTEMPTLSGVDVMNRCRASGDATPFVLITDYVSIPELSGLDGVVFLEKPFGLTALEAAVARALGDPAGQRRSA